MTGAIVLTGPQDLATVARRADWLGYPCTVSVRKGAHRSHPANRLAQMWAGEVAAQLGDRTTEEVRGYCKLTHGVPIRMEDEAFAVAWRSTLADLPYAAQLRAMMAPIDTPITRDMSKPEMARYLDAIWADFSSMGIRLTHPDDRGRTL